ncbi:hypothetical protein [Tenacibaculum sp. 190524A02b]|uniref:hypothetical protein n=1 Tax=Tenacibaculum vairaonense TaxID=3137860 RepID=UPI0031FB04AB
MKKLIALAILGCLAIACTDNTAEHEELSNKIQNIDKENDTHVGGGGGEEEEGPGV